MTKKVKAILKEVPMVYTEIEYTDPEDWMTIEQVVSNARKQMLRKMKQALHEKIAMLTEQDLIITIENKPHENI